MARYIVTGASGYIGSVLCKRLKDLNHTVIALDVDPIRHSYYDAFLFQDYKDKFDLALLIKKTDGIFHLAASSLLNPSLDDPLSYYENNVASFYKFLRTINHFRPKMPVVFASSAAVYGESAETCYASSSACRPINPYGFTKLQAEQALNDITKYTGKVPHISFRFFNVVGGYGDVGHSIERPAILTSLSRAAINKKEFKRFGNNARDYIHVLDVCSAMIAGMDSITADTSISLNLCSGTLTETKKVVDLFQRFTDKELKIKKAENRAGDPEILKGDVTETLDYLKNWSPVHSTWKDMIESHWEYVKYARKL